MPIVVQCNCGSRYQAPDHLLGKTLPCPACGRNIAVYSHQPPVTATASVTSTAPQGSPSSVVVGCRCGQQFMAPANLFGQNIACPACRSPLQVPYPASAGGPIFNQGSIGTAYPQMNPAPYQGGPLNQGYNPMYGPQGYPGGHPQAPSASFELSPRVVRGMIIAGCSTVALVLLIYVVPPLFRSARDSLVSLADPSSPLSAPANPHHSPSGQPTVNPFVPTTSNTPPSNVPPTPPRVAPTPPPSPPTQPIQNPFDPLRPTNPPGNISGPPSPTSPPATTVSPPPPSEPVFVDLGEQIVAAETQQQNGILLRPKSNYSIYRLSNLRVGETVRGPQIAVHYDRVSGTERGIGPILVVRTQDGKEHRIPDVFFRPRSGQNPSGDVVVSFMGVGGPRGGGAPKNLEVYFAHIDRRWQNENFVPFFKVSNSITIGNMGIPPKFAREWTAQETEKVSNVPPFRP